jgi:hypothetical protein
VGLCALLVSGLAAQAKADEQRLTLTPSVSASQNFDRTDVGSAEATDAAGNVVSVPGGEENNGFFELIPAFRARAERPGTRLDLDVSSRFRSSSAGSARSELRGLDETGKIALTQNFGPRFVAFANGSFRNRDSQDPLDRDDAVEIQNDRPDLHEVSGDFTVAYSVTATSQVSLGYSAFARDYQGGVSRSNGNRDVDIGAWNVGYSKALTPLDRIGLSFSYQNLRFGTINTLLLNGRTARTDVQDDQIFSVFANWTRSISPMWTANLTAGVRRLETDGGGFRGFDSPIGDAAPDESSTGFIGSLSFERETEWNRTVLGYRRETRPSGGVGTSLDVDSFELSFTQQLLRNLSLKLRGDYQISKSATDAFVLQPAFLVGGLGGLQPGCLGDGALGTLDGVFTCVAQASNSVDTDVLRLGAELTWRWTRGFVTFLSYDFRDQDVEGIIGGRDRDSSRVRLGFRYAYDYEVY